MPQRFKVIKAKALDRRELEKFPYETVKEFIETEVVPRFDSTTKDFQSDVEFKKSITDSRRKVVGYYSTSSETYYYLTRGTRVRYAVMSADFQAKTRPGTLPSRPGRGGFVALTNNPLPGIKARNFDKIIKARTEKKFLQIAKRKLREAVKRSGHAK